MSKDLSDPVRSHKDLDKDAASYFKKAVHGHPNAIYPTCINQPLSKSGVLEAFEWFSAQIYPGGTDQADKSKDDKEPKSALHPVSETLSQKVESFVTRIEEDSDPEVFLEQFNSYTLPSWDHYTHLRLAFVILNKYGRQKGNNKIICFYLGLKATKRKYLPYFLALAIILCNGKCYNKYNQCNMIRNT